jgi:hypothetical protein
MKTNIKHLKATGQIGKKKTKKQIELLENNELTLEHLRALLNENRGDPYMCQILFLAAIGKEVVEEFFEKVRKEVTTEQYVAIPARKEVVSSNKRWKANSDPIYYLRGKRI